MSKKWIFVTTPENLRICLKYNVFGVDERYEITATEHISPGDYIFFYTTRKMEFIGPFRIKQAGKYMENHPAIKEWKPKDKYKIIIQLDRPQEITTTNLETVFNKLLFITNKRTRRPKRPLPILHNIHQRRRLQNNTKRRQENNTTNLTTHQ